MKLFGLILLTAAIGCNACGSGGRPDDIEELEDTMDLTQFPSTTRVHHPGGGIPAPFSGESCAYYEVEVVYDTPQETYLIGNLASTDVFYTTVGESLVEVDLPKLDLEPQYSQSFQTSSIPENIRADLARLGWLDDAKAYPAFTIHEKILISAEAYSLKITKSEFVLPPETPDAAPKEGVTYEFTFSEGN
ncbi:MAG: hypothetical protein Q7T11_04105 [Deltaproteobacteria bacterium]|nr:hypothetical protein [Deltaproteobacteria bacterium]